MSSKIRTDLRQLRQQLDAFGDPAADPGAPLALEEVMRMPPAAQVGNVYAMLRAAGELLPALLPLPARIAENVILLLSGIDAASAAGLWQVAAAPLELNRLAQRIVADNLTIWQAEIDGDPPPEWAAQRLDALEIRGLLAATWDRPFGALETGAAAWQRFDRERIASV